MSRVLVSGEVRASLVRMDSETPYLQATVVELPDDEVVSGEREEDDPMNREAMIRGLQDVFKEYLLKNPKLSKELGMQVESIHDLKLPDRCDCCKYAVFIRRCAGTAGRDERYETV